MKLAIAIALAGAAGASDPTTAQTSEPPVVEITDVFGKTRRAQYFPVDFAALKLKPLTAAKRNYIFGTLPDDQSSVVRVTVTCPVRPSGHVVPFTCTARQGVHAPTELAGLRFVTQGVEMAQLLPEIGNAQAERILRFVKIEIPLDPRDRPRVDFTTGPLVPGGQFSHLFARISEMDYPPAALRAGVEGNLAAICKVQDDYSIICLDEAFNPPGNARHFAGFMSARLRNATAPQRLLDGTDTRGVRWRINFVFRLPKDAPETQAAPTPR